MHDPCAFGAPGAGAASHSAGEEPHVIGGLFGAIADLLALLGGAALVLRLMRAAAQFTLSSAEAAAASGLADAGARRGDLTAMSEGREAVRNARLARRTSLGLGLAFFAWLILPAGLGILPEAYALAAPLWLLPTPRRAGRA